MTPSGRAVVIGIGHPHRRDDAVGLAVVDALRHSPVDATLVISTGEATALMEAWSGVGTAIVVDALWVPGGRPGRIHRFLVRPDDEDADGGTGTDIQAGAPASSHGVAFGETVALARVLGRVPDRLVVYAIEVAETGRGDEISPAVAEAVRTVADTIRAELAG